MIKPEAAQFFDRLPEFRRSEASSLSQAQTCLGGQPVSYTVKRSRRRSSISLTIDERGLRIGAPWRASERAIEDVLRKHSAWVLRKLAVWQERRPVPCRWQDGETLMLLGQPLRLTLVPGLHGARVEGAQFIASSAWSLEPDGVKQIVTDWMRAEALQCFHARVAHFHPRLGVPEPQIRLSNARTRWGSCHAGGRIHLNWRLIQMPLPLVDYVVVHELAHLVQMNHSPRFWKTVERIIPDYAARRVEIRTGSHRYMLI